MKKDKRTNHLIKPTKKDLHFVGFEPGATCTQVSALLTEPLSRDDFVLCTVLLYITKGTLLPFTFQHYFLLYDFERFQPEFIISFVILLGPMSGHLLNCLQVVFAIYLLF